MISIKLNDMLYENPMIDLSYLISFNNSDDTRSKIELSFFIPLLKSPVVFPKLLELRCVLHVSLLNLQ